MEVYELIIDEEIELSGVEAISIVESPAIEENFVALNKQMQFNIDEDKRLLVGALLVPDKKIFRRDADGYEYEVFFTKETIQKASQLYLKNAYQNNATYEHKDKINGLTLVESWIIEDTKNDKSNFYKLNLPLGSWVGVIKVDNEVIWKEFVKTKKVKGFSIEGYFVDKLTKLAKDEELQTEINAGMELLRIKAELLKTLTNERI